MVIVNSIFVVRTYIYLYGRVLLGLFGNRNTRNRRYLCSFGSYSVRSAPDSRMNRMEGIWFTRNRQNTRYTRSFGTFLAGNPTRPLSPIAPGRHGSSRAQKRMGGETPTGNATRLLGCVMRRETGSRALEVATVQKMAAKEV